MTAAALGYRNIRGQYFMSLESVSQKIFTPKIASMFSSDQESEIYKWLDDLPVMRKQGATGAQGGPQVRKTLKDVGITVYNDVYEAELYFNKHDKRRDKTGQVLRRVSELGMRAAELPDKLITQVIEANGTASDGVAFFASGHSTGSNDITVTGIADPTATTITKMEEVIRKATQQIFAQKDGAGEPANAFATDFVVMAHHDVMGFVSAAIRNLTTADSGVVSRSTTGAMQQEFGIRYFPVVNSRLTSNTRVYLFRTDAPIGSLIWQDEVLPDISMLDEGSEHAIKTGEILVKAERVCAAAVGRHQLAIRATMAA